MQSITPVSKFFEGEHEELILCRDASVGLKAVIAIHNTQLGPALGGLRMWPYKTIDDAIEDALRLSKGMTYKAAIAGLNLGGGKSVIIGDPSRDKSEALFRSFGNFIESLNGRYITAEDVGTDVNDIDYIYMQTKHVVGVAKSHGGSGDPSPWTAKGVFEGILACVEFRFGVSELTGLKIAIQGIGHVGKNMVEIALERGMHVFISDLNLSRCEPYRQHPNVTIVPADQIYEVETDIFCPSALGAVINEKTIPKLRCQIVAGSANNQLANEEAGNELFRRKIVYAPDYVVNVGGLMNVSIELDGYNEQRAKKMISNIYPVIKNILQSSKDQKLPEYQCADRLAEERIARISRLQTRYLGKSSSSVSVR